MNREIKFRAWDKKENRFFPWHTTKLHLGNWASKPESFPEIMLMQFTGLKDKNGKEIFEGDIVKHASLEKEIGSIAWGFDGWTVKLPKWDENLRSFGYPNDNGTPRIEVIGNVWENPELLEGTRAL